MASKLVNGRKVLVGSKADPDSKKFLRASGGRNVTLADGSVLDAQQSKDYGTTPTVISNDNIVSNVIPELESRADKITGTNTLGQQTQQAKEESDLSEYDITGSGKTEYSDPYLDQQFKLLDEQRRMLDSSEQQDIARVQSGIQRLMAEQSAINQANTAGVRGALMRGGNQFRYSPLGSFGGVAGEATAGVRALTGLMAQESELISGIRVARQQKDYQLLENKLGLLDEVRKERQAATKAASEAIAAAERKSMVDNAVIEQIQAGLTSPMDIFSALGGQVSFDEISAITKELPKQDPFTLGSQDIRFDASGNIIAKGSKVGGGTGTVLVGDALSVGNPVVTVGAPTVQGLGTTYANSTVDAQLIIDDIVNGLPTQLINNVAEIPRWQESVRKQLAAGYQPQQIIDKLSGFRIFDETKKPLGDVFYNLAIGTSLEPQVISDLINRGATEQVMTTVENAQLENANGFFAGTDKARSTLKQADTVLTILSDPNFPADKLGPFDGRTFKVGRFAGLTDAETLKVQQLESALQLLNAPIRLEVAGTAATPEEMAKITAFQADILSQPEIIKSQVESLRDSVLGFHNEARAQRGLPTVDRQQAIDNNKRLNLYKGLASQNAQIQYGELSNEALLDSILNVPYSPAGSASNADFFNSLTPTQ